MVPIYLVVACDEANGIGKDGKLPWRLKKEMQYFKKLTTETQDPKKQNMVVMGRKTWESIPEKFRPLPGRVNVVLTHQDGYEVPGALVCASIKEAMQGATEETIENIFLIGGAEVYKMGLALPELTGVYLTRIIGTFDCDTFLPELPLDLSHVQVLGREEEEGIFYEYLLYTRE